jgi:hypothetical protein
MKDRRTPDPKIVDDLVVLATTCPEWDVESPWAPPPQMTTLERVIVDRKNAELNAALNHLHQAEASFALESYLAKNHLTAAKHRLVRCSTRERADPGGSHYHQACWQTNVPSYHRAVATQASGLVHRDAGYRVGYRTPLSDLPRHRLGVSDPPRDR